MKKIAFLIICICTLTTSYSHAQNNADKILLYSDWFGGTYSTSEQVASDSQFFNIHLEIIPCTVADQSGHWYLLKSSFINDIDNPYRLEFYHFSEIDFGFINIDRYKFADSVIFKNDARDTLLLGNLTLNHLQKKERCSIVLSKLNESFAGSTMGKNCPSTLRKSSYAIIDIEISADDFYLWERGFNSKNKQVWGSSVDGHVFKKIDKQ